jgi:hypothetical protein
MGRTHFEASPGTLPVRLGTPFLRAAEPAHVRSLAPFPAKQAHL